MKKLLRGRTERRQDTRRGVTRAQGNRGLKTLSFTTSPAQAQSTVAGLDERVTSAGGRMCKQGQGDTEERAGGCALEGPGVRP